MVRPFTKVLEYNLEVVADYNNVLRTAARKYIVKRRAIAAKHRKQPDATEQQPMQVEGPQLAATTATEQQDIQNVPDEPMLQDSTGGQTGTAADSSQLALSTESQEGAPPEPEEEPPESNRELLTTIAQMSEGIVRASSEKVNVARHAYDLVRFSLFFPSKLDTISHTSSSFSRSIIHVHRLTGTSGI